jgi:type IV pilus assembly protein PilW
MSITMKQRGFSLVELIVAMAIGVVISGALAGLFVSSTKVKQEINRNGEQIENGRLAIDWLSQDIRLAGYWDGLEYTGMADPASDICESDPADLASAVPVYIQGIDNVTSGTTPGCLSDVKLGTDIVAVRRAGTCVIGTTGCESQAPYFQASNCTPPAERLDGTTGVVGQGAELGSPTAANWYAVNASTGSLTLHKRDCGNATVPGAPNLANIRRYVSRIYYIANNDRVGDGLPSLKMAELRGGTWTVSTIASGIEEMHIEYGQTTGGDTTVESYVTAPASVTAWRQVVAAKVHLLSRNSTPTPEYSNSGRTYVLGLKADGSENKFPTTGGSFPDSIRRHAFTGLISIRNPAGLQGG